MAIVRCLGEQEEAVAAWSSVGEMVKGHERQSAENDGQQVPSAHQTFPVVFLCAHAIEKFVGPHVMAVTE